MKYDCFHPLFKKEILEDNITGSYKKKNFNVILELDEHVYII